MRLPQYLDHKGHNPCSESHEQHDFLSTSRSFAASPLIGLLSHSRQVTAARYTTAQPQIAITMIAGALSVGVPWSCFTILTARTIYTRQQTHWMNRRRKGKYQSTMRTFRAFSWTVIGAGRGRLRQGFRRVLQTFFEICHANGPQLAYRSWRGPERSFWRSSSDRLTRMVAGSRGPIMRSA